MTKTLKIAACAAALGTASLATTAQAESKTQVNMSSIAIEEGASSSSHGMLVPLMLLMIVALVAAHHPY